MALSQDFLASSGSLAILYKFKDVLFYFCHKGHFFLMWVLGLEPMTSCMLSMCPTTEPHPPTPKKVIFDFGRECIESVDHLG